MQSLTCSGCSEWVENSGVVCHVSMIFALEGCGNNADTGAKPVIQLQSFMSCKFIVT